ncbi:sushi, von Willebrand factor type A, EGF and pentraxin domain-containing protein 1-like [Penaeus japonicus]|uniref:sushi, von Willebrand factor type A, EGF and pentraxin domain-containing protein 1-like n=1 Tax=Penaeus japonicus TaxID=27405 RepID=UPI001C713765|nr:sushi, von Willebrand factor type A, EGF and pentraxin domain-containing protein 1-like [Penaeus japonicus]
MDEDKNQTYQEVTCIGLLGSWSPSVQECHVYCDGAPPEAPANSSYNWDGFTKLAGTEVTYTCNITGELFGNMNNSITVFCNDNGTWSTVPSSILSCSSVCTDDPPGAPYNATYNWDGYTRTAGTEVW